MVQIALNRHWCAGTGAAVQNSRPVGSITRNAIVGTSLEQAGGTRNWLHLSIPSVETSDNRGPFFFGAVFRGSVTGNAKVDTISVYTTDVLLKEDHVDYVFKEINHTIEMPVPDPPFPQMTQALTLSVHVVFLTGIELSGGLWFRSGATIFGTVVGPLDD